MSKFPSGWYFCARSDEIKAGQIQSKFLFNQKLVLWRTESGTLKISQGQCPHLGSDLGKLGKVVGENLECFSHRYTYNTDGDCVQTGFKTLPCRTKSVLFQFPVHEVSGFILLWYDTERREPTWTLPEDLFAASGMSGFVPSQFEFEGPVEVINEDNFDVGHLYTWHQVKDVKTTPISIKDHTISIAHKFTRHSILFGKPLPRPFHKLTFPIQSQYTSTLYGHGLTYSTIDIFNLGMHMQDIIWCTPISPTRTLYTTFLRRALPVRQGDGLLLPWHLFSKWVIFQFSIWRLRQEHKLEGKGFWENQSPVTNPIWTEAEESLLGPYRKWSAQF